MGLPDVLKNKVVKNASWIIGGKLINKLLAFCVGILTARYLGPSNYGLIHYAVAYTSFFASLCTLGINSIIIKNFVDHPEEEGKTLGTALLLRAVSSFLSAVMIVGIVSIVDRQEPLTITVVALCSLGLVFQIFDTLNYWFQSKLKSKYSAIASILSYVAVSIYKIILLILGKSVKWFAVASALDYVILAAFLLAAYFANGGTKFAVSWTKAKELLRSSSSFIVSGLMVSIYACTDKLMLKQMLDEATVGHYSLASSVSVTWTFVLAAVIDSMYPEIVQSYGKDHLQYERKNRQLYTIVFYVAIFVSALICLLAHPLIRLLYGASYLPAVRPLQIIVWYTAFSYLGVARNAWIVCENLQKYLKYLYMGAAAINIALNLVLIPLWGASGAAGASLITQISTTVFLPAVIRPLRPNAKLMLDAICLRDVLPKRKSRA
ncbi:MAG: flippase [Oscillospiraceae bacterium]